MPCKKSFLVAICLFLTVMFTPAPGQEQLKPLDDMKKKFDETLDKRNKWIQGTEKPNLKDPGTAAAFEAIAEWYAYRTTVSWQNDDKLAEVLKEFERFINDCLPLMKDGKERENKEFVAAIAKPFAIHFKKVLDLDFTPNHRAVIKTAVMLPYLAKLHQEEVGDMLVEVLKDPKQHDAVKLYAIKALREFFPVKIVDEDFDQKSAKAKKKKARDLERIATVAAYIDRKWEAPAGLPNLPQPKDGDNPTDGEENKGGADKKGEEKIDAPQRSRTLQGAQEKGDEKKKDGEGKDDDPPAKEPEKKGLSKMEIDAIRFIRREAILTLARANAPAVAALPKGEIEGEVASMLIKVLQPGKLVPEPSLSEKCEAAAGLLNMKCSDTPEYDATVGIYLAGKFLVTFAEEYRKDYEGVKIANKKPRILWKSYADRMKSGLAQLAATKKEDDKGNQRNWPEAAAAVNKAATAPGGALTIISALQELSPNVVRDLEEAVKALRPKSGVLYPKLSGPTVTLD